MPALILDETPDAPWLPPGGRADVVLDPGGRPPAPTGLVRLLIRRGDTVFCVPKGGGGTLDLPTRDVPALDDGRGTIACLAREILGSSGRPRLVGYVRNVVEVAGTDYPWPLPHAHFSVWEADGEPGVDGVWMPARSRQSPLRDRHWWPLVGGLV